MFEECRAVIIASDPVQSRTLGLVARNLGFADAVDYDDHGGAVRAKLTFCFVGDHMSDAHLIDVLEIVRTERRNNLCYSPVILFTEDYTSQAMLRFVRLGFDDVVTLPVPRANLSEQLGRQLYEDQVYVQTKDYLGPDRRRMDRGTDLRIAASPYAQVRFFRDPETGIHVLGREQRGSRFRTRPNGSTHFMPKLFGPPSG